MAADLSDGEGEALGRTQSRVKGEQLNRDPDAPPSNNRDSVRSEAVRAGTLTLKAGTNGFSCSIGGQELPNGL